MKKIRKISTFLLLLLIIIAALPLEARADGTAAFYSYCDADALSGGDTISVVVAVDNNVPLGSVDIVLDYDTTELSYSSASLGAAASAGTLAVSDEDGEVTLSITDNTSTSDGTVVIVNFTALGDLDSLPVTLSVNNLYDQDGAAYTDYTVDADVEMTSDEFDSSSSSSSSSSGSSSSGSNSSSSSTGSNSSGSSGSSSSSSSTGSGTSGSSSGTSGTSGSSSDKAYKTGAGFGNDVYFVFAGVCIAVAIACFVYNKIKTRG